MPKSAASLCFLKFACKSHFFSVIFVTFSLFTLFYMCYNNHSAKRTSTSSHLHETNVEIEEVIIMLTLKAEKRNPDEKAKMKEELKKAKEEAKEARKAAEKEKEASAE